MARVPTCNPKPGLAVGTHPSLGDRAVLSMEVSGLGGQALSHEIHESDRAPRCRVTVVRAPTGGCPHGAVTPPDSEIASRASSELGAVGRVAASSLDGLAKPDQRARLEEILHLADELDVPGGLIESRDSILRRFKGVRLITDDNMGTEWSTPPQH